MCRIGYFSLVFMTLSAGLVLSSAGCLRYVPSQGELRHDPQGRYVALGTAEEFNAYESKLKARVDALLAERASLVGVIEGESEFPLGQGDVLELEVFGLPELTATPAVSPVGTVSLPLIGELPAAGLTLGELRNEILAKLVKYLRQPQIRLAVKDYNSHKVSVTGEVGKPGTYRLRYEGQPLTDVLAEAGGRTDRAGVRIILIPAATAKKSEPEEEEVKADEVPEEATAAAGTEGAEVGGEETVIAMAGEEASEEASGENSESVTDTAGPNAESAAVTAGSVTTAGADAAATPASGEVQPAATAAATAPPTKSQSEDSDTGAQFGIEVTMDDLTGRADKRPVIIPLVAGDTIIVPEAGTVEVDGEVNKPGSYKLSSQTTVLGAVAAAAGLTYSADIKQVEVIRDVGAGRKALVSLDLENIALKGGQDIPLRNGDLVRVPSEPSLFARRQVIEVLNGVFKFGVSGSVK